ncbi:MAG: hypothetical protein K2M50_04045, partial [Treponemataceae bacterium]|nr:hypothetical protein [Treponemataceae bacterium]
ILATMSAKCASAWFCLSPCNWKNVFPYLNLPIFKAFAFFGIIHYIFKNNTVRVLFKNNFSRYIKWLEI